MDYKVVLSPSARADIRDIVRYISWNAPDRALAFGWFLISKRNGWDSFPKRGGLFLNSTCLRFARLLCVHIA